MTNTGTRSVLPKIDNSRSNDKPLSEKKKTQIYRLYVEMDGGPIMSGGEEMEGDETGGDSSAQDITDAEVSEDNMEGDAYGIDADEEDPSIISTDGDDA
ncbi:hypothetical protein DID88_006573 [Monilinia fructigena]|uniref:Uncharacterized protein n=1 Tax=Monilinia fructigena TaxID=38457 RepID=A0A395IH95_9HELO|nr:hypothetical protein DID88_006573 [Monilinia fructigena]